MSDTDFGARLASLMALDPAAPAVEQAGTWHSWGDLAAAIAAIDATLVAAGLARHHRVGLLLRNRPSQLAAMLALFTTGRTLVVLNPMLAQEALLADLARLRLAAVIGEPADLADPAIQAALAAAGCAVIRLAPDLQGAHLDTPPAADLLGAPHPDQPDTAVEMLTSGTTGPPKRIPLSRRAFDAALDAALIYEKDRRPGDPPKLRPGISLHVGPLAHIGGMFGMLNTLLAGRSIVLFDRFTVPAWREAVVRYRPKVASLVPAALRMLLDADLPREDLASLSALRSGTAPLPPETVFEFLRRYDLPVLQNYGATELIGGIAGWSLPDFRRYFTDKPRSCGRLHDGVDARVIDPATDAVLPPGQEGVLELRTPQLERGDAWYRTTDRAIIDTDRFLTICGRTDNAIIRGGFKIHPDDLVSVLGRHPAIREVAVIGLPDPRLGEVPAAAIILRDAMTLTADEVTAFARAHLSPYQVPTRIVFVPDLPRTPSMKPSLPEVRRLLLDAPQP